MKISMKTAYRDPVGDVDDIDEELTPFQYALEELRRYVCCELLVRLSDDCTMYLEIWPDVTICYEDIVNSVVRVKSGWEGKDYIWFCEQGIDFYLHYEVRGGDVVLAYKKGPGAGRYHGNIPDTVVAISRASYVMEWGLVFKELTDLFDKCINKKITLPF
ncbi:hypothetical protein P5705_12430 [Pseudomonas entomophila]|uniref:hypothetical protein n=1 Tax=Pseudomonas entomophila TaxID=312306 RepID=UPI0024072E9A|nr:hypothetical protein [Pseudomonas entomophila]MDF9618455.1 hypothetical protein [Pseudomonas entomophila]